MNKKTVKLIGAGILAYGTMAEATAMNFRLTEWMIKDSREGSLTDHYLGFFKNVDSKTIRTSSAVIGMLWPIYLSIQGVSMIAGRIARKIKGD